MTVTCVLNLSLLYHFVDSRLMQKGSYKTKSTFNKPGNKAKRIEF